MNKIKAASCLYAYLCLDEPVVPTEEPAVAETPEVVVQEGTSVVIEIDDILLSLHSFDRDSHSNLDLSTFNNAHNVGQIPIDMDDMDKGAFCAVNSRQVKIFSLGFLIEP